MFDRGSHVILVVVGLLHDITRDARPDGVLHDPVVERDLLEIRPGRDRRDLGVLVEFLGKRYELFPVFGDLRLGNEVGIVIPLFVALDVFVGFVIIFRHIHVIVAVLILRAPGKGDGGTVVARDLRDEPLRNFRFQPAHGLGTRPFDLDIGIFLFERLLNTPRRQNHRRIFRRGFGIQRGHQSVHIHQ